MSADWRIPNHTVFFYQQRAFGNSFECNHIVIADREILSWSMMVCCFWNRTNHEQQLQSKQTYLKQALSNSPKNDRKTKDSCLFTFLESRLTGLRQKSLSGRLPVLGAFCGVAPEYLQTFNLYENNERRLEVIQMERFEEIIFLCYNTKFHAVASISTSVRRAWSKQTGDKFEHLLVDFSVDQICR